MTHFVGLAYQDLSSVLCYKYRLRRVAFVPRITRAFTAFVQLRFTAVLLLQAAHVGIGISGVEGLQAACASDYSIAQVGRLSSR